MTDLQQKVKELPDKPGVYIYRDKDRRVIYVGKAINLKSRVRSYFQLSANLGAKTVKLVENIVDMNHIIVETEVEALLLEAELIKRFKPHYNIQLKDDKSPLYIKISTNEEVPRVSTIRRENIPGATYFGPYQNAAAARNVLKMIRRVFPYRSCKTLPKTPCLFYHLKLCSAPCAGLISPSEYKKTITHISLFLKGKRKVLEREIQQEMEKAVEELRFEDAARCKKQLDDLHYILQSFHAPREYIENPNLLEDRRNQVLSELHSILSPFMSLPTLPRRIECYDISNIQGTNPVGAMTVFTDGEPDKREYRKFKIRSKDTPDDFTMMNEMLQRRFDNDWPMPDLVVIDGGKGQLSVALQAIASDGVKVPTISLAKRLEEVFIPKDNTFVPQTSYPNLPEGVEVDILDKHIRILIPKRSKALHVLQAIRDEAHRFGITFHRKLRAKKMLEK